jgi:hypothetical protein
MKKTAHSPQVPGHLRHRCRLACAVAALVGFLAVQHGAIALGANAAPLGMEIGVATYAQVKERIGKLTALEETGTNKYSGGQMLAGKGQGLEVEGLKDITFIFDRAGSLQGVLMTLEKSFRATYEKLRKKYKVTSQRIPFVGDAEARFAAGDSVIVLDAPHMSFEMTLSYLSQTFLASFQARAASDRAKREQAQRDKL